MQQNSVSYLDMKYKTEQGVVTTESGTYPEINELYDVVREAKVSHDVLSVSVEEDNGTLYYEGVLRLDGQDVYVGDTNITSVLKEVPTNVETLFRTDSAETGVSKFRLGYVTSNEGDALRVEGKDMTDLKEFEGQYVVSWVIKLFTSEQRVTS